MTLTSNYVFFSYKHALDGIMRISREEGASKLFNGAQWASTRAVAVTIGQLCFYDFIKLNLLKSGYFKDNLTTHFTSSLCAVSDSKSTVTEIWNKKKILFWNFFLHEL